MNEGETLGKYLRQQRESKKISLREVAKSTKVREHLLEAIEEDQHHLLPPATYVKGFLLSYAKYLGLNPKDVLMRYRRDLKGEPVTPSLPQPQKQEPKVPPKPSPTPESRIPFLPLPEHGQKTPLPRPPEPRRRILLNIKQIWVVGGVIAVSFIFFYFFSPYPSKLPIEPVLEKPVPEKLPIEPTPPVTAAPSAAEEKPVVEERQPPAPSLPATATTSVLEKKPLSLQIKAIEETWVSLRVDDQSEREITFKPGEGISVQASNQLRMIIGNAGGLHLILGEKPLDKFGKSGEVVTLIITSKGVEVKRPEKPKPAQE